MNPELPAPQMTPENSPAQPENGGEHYQGISNSERTGERSREHEQYMRSVDQQVAPMPAPVIAPPVPQPVPVPVPQPAVASDDNPIMAGDDDLIEKEWVDKAKKIIAETRDDPYKREREVNKLQADYLMKRYGKELGSAD